MGDAGWGGVAVGALPDAVVAAGAARTASAATSARVVGITGNSASFPLSNSIRHSSGTEAGSRRYSSYITCTNAALLVPKTKELTRER